MATPEQGTEGETHTGQARHGARPSRGDLGDLYYSLIRKENIFKGIICFVLQASKCEGVFYF